jgi:hypothetical protein
VFRYHIDQERTANDDEEEEDRSERVAENIVKVREDHKERTEDKLVPTLAERVFKERLPDEKVEAEVSVEEDGLQGDVESV